jgi:hypothetical protein
MLLSRRVRDAPGRNLVLKATGLRDRLQDPSRYALLRRARGPRHGVENCADRPRRLSLREANFGPQGVSEIPANQLHLTSLLLPELFPWRSRTSSISIPTHFDPGISDVVHLRWPRFAAQPAVGGSGLRPGISRFGPRRQIASAFGDAAVPANVARSDDEAFRNDFGGEMPGGRGHRRPDQQLGPRIAEALG